MVNLSAILSVVLTVAIMVVEKAAMLVVMKADWSDK